MIPTFTSDAVFESFPSPTSGEASHYSRELWPPGPWHAEPHDKVSWVDPATGLDCLLVRNQMGGWCGYVGVPPTHPWYGRDYNACGRRRSHKQRSARQVLQRMRRRRELASSRSSRDMWNSLAEMHKHYPRPERACSWDHSISSLVSVHGGLTYSAGCQEGGRICHPHAEGAAPTYWFGFDTGHLHDVLPGMLASSAYMRDRLRNSADNDLFRDHLDYDPADGTLDKYGMHASYRDMTYVKAEVEKLAAQLKEFPDDTHG